MLVLNPPILHSAAMAFSAAAQHVCSSCGILAFVVFIKSPRLAFVVDVVLLLY